MIKTPKLSHLWDRHPDDWYVEPEWTSKRLFEEIEFQGEIFDPACGRGNILASARAHGLTTSGADIEKRFKGSKYQFGKSDWMASDARAFDNIVSNPPFSLCQKPGDDFVSRCLSRATRRVALLLPATWGHGLKRAKWLQQTPLEFICPLTPRPSMPPGPVIEAGEKPGGGTKDFSWFIWRKGYGGYPMSVFIMRDRK